MGLLWADLYKLARHALFRGLAVALLALVLLRGLVWPPDPSLPWAGLWSANLVVAAVIVLTAVTVGMEFSEDTFRSLTSRGVPRWGLLLSKFVALVLAGGILLVGVEGLATLLGVRSELRWVELWRAWLSLWPYVGFITLLTVLARNGGLALVVGVLWLALEQFAGLLMAPLVMLADVPQFGFMRPEGFLGILYQWTLSYHGANWTYLAEWQRAPVSMNVLLWAMPHTAVWSSLVLAAYTLLGLGSSILIVCRRDVSEVVEGERRGWGLTRGRAHPAGSRRRRRWDALPAWTGKGPRLARLVRAHIFKAGRTSLIRIGSVVSLLFPLVLWGAARALKDAGFEDSLFVAGAEGGAPLAITLSLLLVGPLATVVAILGVSNELSLGTRRAELTRGVTRAQTIVAQSLALLLTVGGLFILLMAIVLVLGAVVSGDLPLGGGVRSVLVAVLATGAYVGAVQMGGALTRSPLGAMLFGLGFLMVDWFAVLAPTLTWADPGLVPDLGRYTVFTNAFSLATRGQTLGMGIDWIYLGGPTAGLLLLAYAVASHALAVVIAHWRDA